MNHSSDCSETFNSTLLLALDWGYCVTSENGTLEDCFGKEGLDKVGKVVGDHMIILAAQWHSQGVWPGGGSKISGGTVKQDEN